MISRTGRYALNILGYLVRHQGTLRRSAEISKSTGIPSNYLSKILNQLRKQGAVEGVKGWGGGFQLRPEVLKRPIQEILKQFDGVEIVGRKECLFGLPECDEEHPCPLHPYWERIHSAYSEMLAVTKVADLGGFDR